MKTIQKLASGAVEVTTNGHAMYLTNPENLMVIYKNIPANDFPGRAADGLIKINKGSKTLLHFLLSELSEISGVPFSGTAEDAATLIANNILAGGDVTPIKLDQVISVSKPDGPIFSGTQSFQIEAESTSGLPLSYASSDEESISVDENGLMTILVGTGTATITITQAGDALYNAATPYELVVVVEEETTP